MTDIAKGCSASLCIKEAIEKVISEKLHIDLKIFNIHDYERRDLNKIIKLANEEYEKNPERAFPHILWEDFYHWYNDYRT